MSQGFVNSNNLPLPLSVVNGGTGVSTSTGTGAVVLNTIPTLINPIINAGLRDINFVPIINFLPQPSAVNWLAVANAPTSGAVSLFSTGADANIGISIISAGVGRVQIKGIGVASSVSPGFVGEFVSSVIPSTTPVSLSNTVAANVTSISLTAGDWDVWGNVFFSVNGTASAEQGWVSSTSATLPDQSLISQLQATSIAAQAMVVPQLRFLLNATTTIYLSARALFSTGTVLVSGGIYARRVS